MLISHPRHRLPLLLWSKLQRIPTIEFLRLNFLFRLLGTLLQIRPQRPSIQPGQYQGSKDNRCHNQDRPRTPGKSQKERASYHPLLCGVLSRDFAHDVCFKAIQDALVEVVLGSGTQPDLAGSQLFGLNYAGMANGEVFFYSRRCSRFEVPLDVEW
jgi:hypothetical protein